MREKNFTHTQATDTHTQAHTLFSTPTLSRICKLTTVCRCRENKNGAAAAGSAAAATLTAGLDGSAFLFSNF